MICDCENPVNCRGHFITSSTELTAEQLPANLGPLVGVTEYLKTELKAQEARRASSTQQSALPLPSLEDGAKLFDDLFGPRRAAQNQSQVKTPVSFVSFDSTPSVDALAKALFRVRMRAEIFKNAEVNGCVKPQPDECARLERAYTIMWDKTAITQREECYTQAYALLDEWGK